jgi:hypothetical protein
MLFTDNLEEIIFHRHDMFDVDELIVLSGYVGPKPVERLKQLPFESKVIYGMYGSEGIQRPLHNSLLDLQKQIKKVNIFYSNLPVHSKCYAWLKKGDIVHALVGSANFSTNGLATPYREVLAETSHDTFKPLNNYLKQVLVNSISCLEVVPQGKIISLRTSDASQLTLLGRNGEVQNVAGLNWGQNPKNHTNHNDAYIKIRVEDIYSYPDLFPPKQLKPTISDKRGRANRHNDAIEIIWDDGYRMAGLLEGTQPINNMIYPKQISSFPTKSELGVYLRKRIGVPLGQPVRRFHLDKYGRTDIVVSKLAEGVYRFDFSKRKH